MLLLNRSATRRYILDNIGRWRPGWDCRRVSAEGLEAIEARLRAVIKSLALEHPSIGKTFKP